MMVVAGGGRALRASVKCMMEGCRTMVGAESEICDSCRRKQMQAYEGSIQQQLLWPSLYSTDQKY